MTNAERMPISVVVILFVVFIVVNLNSATTVIVDNPSVAVVVLNELLAFGGCDECDCCHERQSNDKGGQKILCYIFLFCFPRYKEARKAENHCHTPEGGSWLVGYHGKKFVHFIRGGVMIYFKSVRLFLARTICDVY